LQLFDGLASHACSPGYAARDADNRAAAFIFNRDDAASQSVSSRHQSGLFERDQYIARGDGYSYALAFAADSERDLDYASPFFVGYLDALPVMTGGWRFREDVSRLGSTCPAEVKRMYVAPTARRRGLARVMLAHLEATARAAGADVMIMETGTAQPEAMALYEAAGYESVAPFGHYAWSPRNRCYARVLPAIHD